MHRLIASPFLKQHLLLRPGSRGGVLLPAPRYEELRALDPAEPSPSWFADSIRDQWADLASSADRRASTRSSGSRPPGAIQGRAGRSTRVQLRL